MLRILAAFSIATLMMLVKLASERGIALPEIMFWRLALTVPVVFGVLAATGRLDILKTRRLKNHALRATISTLGMASLFGATILLTLPQASVLTFTSPLFAVLFSALIIREAVGIWRWVAVVVGFCGVLVLARPGTEGFNMLGAAAGLTAALVVVVVSYQLKDLARTDDPIACVFYLSLFAAIYVSVTLPFFARSHDTTEWLLLLAIGAAGLTSQYVLTMSLKYGSVATILIMDYTLLIWSTLYSLIIWSELPPHATWFGAPLIIAAGLIITWREHRLSRQPSPVSTGEID
jgi:drug/metabolite transporter (DMT)-like permease